MIRAKVKETDKFVYLRKPYYEEYTSSIYEPDFVEVDEKGDTIRVNGYDNIEWDEDELYDIDYFYNEKTKQSDDPNRAIVDKIRELLHDNPVNLGVDMTEDDMELCCNLIRRIKDFLC